MLREQSKIKFDFMGVFLMGLSSLHAAYGPGDYWYIQVVIKTTRTCLDLGVELRNRLSLLFFFTNVHMEIQIPLQWYIACCSGVNNHLSTYVETYFFLSHKNRNQQQIKTK